MSGIDGTPGFWEHTLRNTILHPHISKAFITYYVEAFSISNNLVTTSIEEKEEEEENDIEEENV